VRPARDQPQPGKLRDAMTAALAGPAYSPAPPATPG
jgi:hypothetical protein